MPMTQQDIRIHYESEWKITSESAPDTTGLRYSNEVEDAVLYPAYEQLVADLKLKVDGGRVLDVGSGNGYLGRKLARAGAAIQGIELSDRFAEMAEEREREEKLGIEYHQGSASDMGFLPDDYFDLAVANYVLMDIHD